MNRYRVTGKRIVVALVVVGAAVAACATYALHLSLQDSVDTRRGSAPYYLLISSEVVRKCPVIAGVTEPMFSYRSGDGPAPLENAVVFVSSAPPERILVELDAYVRGQGYVRRPNETVSGYRSYWKGCVQVLIHNEETEEGLTRVTVTELFDN